MASDLSSKEPDGLSRRELLLVLGAAAGALASYSNNARAAPARASIAIEEIGAGEDVFAYVSRLKGGFDQGFYQQLIGAANDFK
jgi:ethanolamine ammonia-lyase large subunit